MEKKDYTCDFSLLSLSTNIVSIAKRAKFSCQYDETEKVHLSLVWHNH